MLNCLARRRPWDSAAWARWAARIFSRGFPRQLRSDIGLHPLASSFCSVVLPALGIVATWAYLNVLGQCPIARDALYSWLKTLVSGRPHVLRNPAGSPSGPGAFQGATLAMAFSTLACVISISSGVRVGAGTCCRSSGRAPGLTVGKNLAARIVALSARRSVAGAPSSGCRAGIPGGGGGWWLQCLAHLANFYRPADEEIL